MKYDKDTLIKVLKQTKDRFLLWNGSYFICIELVKVSLSNPKYEKETIYLKRKIQKRLRGHSTAEGWLIRKHNIVLSMREMKEWRVLWIDKLIAEIEEHGRLL